MRSTDHHDAGISPNPASYKTPELRRSGVVALGTYFVCLSIVLIYLLFELWPTYYGQDGVATITESTITLLGGSLRFTVSPEVQLILLVIVAAALGSYIHAATSFADFIGNRRFSSSWVWWYVLRVFIGVSLALIFYFVLRGGLLTAGAGASNISPFGVTAVAGMVGMFSKQATDKLNEVFNTLFRSDKPVERLDKLVNPVPQIRRVNPLRLVMGDREDQRLDIIGEDFLPGSIVVLQGIPIATTFVSPSQLSALVSPQQMVSPGEVSLVVFSPTPGGGVSNEERLLIESDLAIHQKS
jgi:hypothetical protein